MSVERQESQRTEHHVELAQRRGRYAAQRIEIEGEAQSHAIGEQLSAEPQRVEHHLQRESQRRADQQLLAAPLLLVALAIGLLVGIFQAATQINEMTLSFIPKLIGMAVALLVAGPWMLRELVSYTRTLIESIPSLVG